MYTKWYLGSGLRIFDHLLRNARSLIIDYYEREGPLFALVVLYKCTYSLKI